MRGASSLDVINDEVQLERQEQAAFFNAIDTKAGIVLGFAAAIVALGPDSQQRLALAGRWVAVTSGLLGLASFWPRTYWQTDLAALRESYLSAEAEFTRLRLLNAHIGAAERTHDILTRKAVLLKAGMLTLVVAVVLSALGFALHLP